MCSKGVGHCCKVQPQKSKEGGVSIMAGMDDCGHVFNTPRVSHVRTY